MFMATASTDIIIYCWKQLGTKLMVIHKPEPQNVAKSSLQ